jgi:hypothetical protein
MVSSTFYDLRQIRADLEEFLAKDLGYHPLLSEFPSFPVDPDKTTIENCRRRVQQNADVVVLVIGGRYGSVPTPHDKSVTNLEYQAARATGLPVYAFVEKRILSSLPLWRDNPDGDFSKVVDSPRLFQFVMDVREQDGVWTFEFETAQDIIQTLRIQFAHLFRETLGEYVRVRRSGLEMLLQGLGPEAFALALEQPAAWEYRLFFRVVQDEIDQCRDLRMRYDHGLALGIGERVSMFDIQAWSAPRLDELRRIVAVLSGAINDRLPEALGAPGEPADARDLVAVARLVGEAYRGALEWSLRVRCAAGSDALQPVVDALARFPDDALTKVESLGSPMLERFADGLARATKESPITIEVTLEVDLSHSDEFHEALDRLERDIASGNVEVE